MKYFLVNGRWQSALVSFLTKHGIKVDIINSIRILAEGNNIPTLVTEFEGDDCCKQKRHIHVTEVVGGVVERRSEA